MVNENQVPKKKKKGCLIAFLVVAAVFVGFVVLVIALNPSSPSGTNSKRSDLAILLDASDEQEAAILKVFEDCGIKMTSIKLFQSGENKSSYYVSTADAANIVVWLNNENKQIEEIYFNDFDIYTENEVKANLYDYVMTKEEKDSYRLSARNAVTSILTAPDTAKFSESDWRYGKIDGEYMIQGKVSAKNAFGVQFSSPFQVKWKDLSIISLIIDGEEKVSR